MFGHDDNAKTDDNAATTDTAADKPAEMVMPAPDGDDQPSGSPSAPYVLDSSKGGSDDAESASTDEPSDTSSGSPDDTTTSTDSDDTATTTTEEEPAADSSASNDDLISSVPSMTPAGATSDDDLLSIKQQALKQLSPLVDQLNQTPEEKFRTTMMMIQAADDESLLKTAYSAAESITDEKTRAQALLDIINEINYFTQQHTS